MGLRACLGRVRHGLACKLMPIRISTFDTFDKLSQVKGHVLEVLCQPLEA